MMAIVRLFVAEILADEIKFSECPKGLKKKIATYLKEHDLADFIDEEEYK